jgi:hypothetical protein
VSFFLWAISELLTKIGIMKRLLTVLVMLSASAVAQDFSQAKLLDVVAFTVAGPSIIAPNGQNPVIIPTSRNMFTITVALNDMSYSAQYPQARHFRPSELIVGDQILARIDGDKLILKTSDGKEMKAKIVRRARLIQN